MLTSTYPTPVGDLKLIVNDGYLVCCNWITADCEDKIARIEKICQSASESQSDEEISLMKECRRQLNDYFAGKLVNFRIPVKFIGTPFQENVWHAISNIGYGKTITYKKLASECGCAKGFQAVAQACGKNPVAVIVPCHRVVAANGTRGGYTGGIDKKNFLLELESCNFLTLLS